MSGGETPRVSDGANHQDGIEVRSVPDALFAATKRPPQGNDRMYYHDSRGVGFGTAALYGEEMIGMPNTLLRHLGNRDTMSIGLPTKSDDTVRFHAQTGNFSLSLRYFPHEGEELAPLYDISLDDNTISRYERGHKSAGMLDYWTNMRGRRDLSEIMRRGGLTYDPDAGIFEVRLGDMVVRALTHAPVHGILESYFPPELRENPFEAGIELDVWARADWMADFGISWAREVVTVAETPIFQSSRFTNPVLGLS